MLLWCELSFYRLRWNARSIALHRIESRSGDTWCLLVWLERDQPRRCLSISLETSVLLLKKQLSIVRAQKPPATLPDVSVAPIILSGTSPRSKPSFLSVFFFADDLASNESVFLRFLASVAATDARKWKMLSTCRGNLALFTFFLFHAILKSRNQLGAIQVFLRLPSIVCFGVSLPF